MCETSRTLTWLSVLGREEEYRFTTYRTHKRRISIMHADREIEILLTFSINIENGVDLLSDVAAGAVTRDI